MDGCMDGCICVCMHVYMQIHCKSKSLEVFQPESNMINKPKETGLVLLLLLFFSAHPVYVVQQLSFGKFIHIHDVFCSKKKPRNGKHDVS